MELTYKLALRCRTFAFEMGKSNNLLTMISTITRENPTFPYNQGRVKIFRDGVINWQHQNKGKKLVNQTKVDWITNYSKKRLTLLNQVIEQAKNMPDTAASDQQVAEQAGYDSDDDFYGQQLEAG